MNYFDRFIRRKKKRVYLDYAAATPVRSEVLTVMQRYWDDVFANPGAIHEEGQHANRAVKEARLSVQMTLNAQAQHVTFTSGGTEVNNLALFGVVEAVFAKSDVAPRDIEIISTKIEHPSILESLKRLEERGVVVHYVHVDQDGKIKLAELKKLLNNKTVLVTFAYVNSEVGVVEDVKKITHAVRLFKKEHQDARVYVHLDASQAPLWLPCKMDSLGVDMMTLEGGKIYGPKGVGVLVHKKHVALTPQALGGGQESGRRAGTENVPLVVGFSKALEIAQEQYEVRSRRVTKLREYLLENIEKDIQGVSVNGSREDRVANNVNISIDGVDGEFAVVKLDVRGVAASTRSACGGRTSGGSHVVRELYGDAERASGTIRFTLGEETMKEELSHVVQVLSEHAHATQKAK